MATIYSLSRSKSNWLETYARFGMAAKGVVYVILGALTLSAALGIGGQTADRKEALHKIVEQPFGQVLLALVAFGLLGYTIWRFIQGIKDPDNKGNDAKGWFHRIGYLASGVIYGIFTLYAAKLLMGTTSGSNGGNNNQFIVNKLLEQSFGQYLVILLGAIILIKGIRQFYRGFSGSFRKNIQDMSINPRIKDTYNKLGRLGYLSRGVVFAIVGYFFFVAGIHANPGAAKDTEGVFHFLNQSGGPWLMGIIALGLLGYGVFMFVKAKYIKLGNI